MNRADLRLTLLVPAFVAACAEGQPAAAPPAPPQPPAETVARPPLALTRAQTDVLPPPPAPPPEEPLPPPLPAVAALSGGSDSPIDRALAAGDHALDAGDLVTALRGYEQARTLAPKAAPPLVGLARVRITKTDLPMDYAAGSGNADILAAKGMLKRAVAIDPAFAPALVELGRALLLLGDADGALDTLHRAVALAPGDAEAHSVLGVASLATGHPDVAIDELRAAAKLDLGSAARHGNLGTACLITGKVEDAVHEYELEVRIAGGDARAHSDLGTALLARGEDLGRAISELERAVSIDPSRATFHSNLGYALQMQGKVTEAIVEYRAALARDTHLASAWINLATALAKDPKTRGEARAALGEARKIDAKDPRVKANEEELDALEHGKTAP
jgi:Flp pilus assembly protein TadD